MTPSPGCGTLGKSVALFGLQEAQEAGVHLQGPICRSGLVMGATWPMAWLPTALRSLVSVG